MHGLTIDRKLCLGFGILVVFIAVLGLTAFMGVNGIVSDSMSMITGSRINEVLKQREIDHLNWLAKLTRYMQDHNTKELDVQTDDHQCGLGKWLYGEERKQAESAVPELAPLLQAMEEPHRVLHHSAEEIARYSNKLNTGKLLSDFYRLERDHLLWYETAIEEVIQRKDKISVQLDDRACELGRWLYGPEAEQLRKAHPDFEPLFEQLKAPHKRLHDIGRQINERLAHADFSGAMDLVQGQVKQSVNEVRSILTGARELVRKKYEDQERADNIFSTVSMKSIADLQALMHQASERVSGRMTSQDSVLNAASKLKLTIGVIGALAALAGFATALLICASIKGPLVRLRDTLSDASEQVAAASTQVSASSQHLAEGASEQAGSLEETSASLEEMASMTKQNAANASQANSLMREAERVVERASGSMLGMVASMQEISRASEEIQKIIKTIDEIAFQTNLLALNAAVEAARAGEAGAGFAVVADEVRNLAMRAADAAGNTALLIEGSVNKVREGAQLVEETNREFGEVAGIVKKSGELIGEIASASGEQAQGIEQLTVAITEMDKITQQNATTAEESASSAEEMSSQAAQMREFVFELAALVGGAGHVERKRPPSIRMGATGKAERTLVPVSAADAGAGRGRSTTLPPPGTGRAKELSPEKILPLDDDF